jgi:hypothetical protein
MEPDRGYPQDATAHDTFWDFISLLPESMNMVLWIMSDRTIPRSLRMMEGFGIHTFRLVNADGKSTFVKFHWRPIIGSVSVIWGEAVKINGAHPDFHRRDLYEAIAKGAFQPGRRQFERVALPGVVSAPDWCTCLSSNLSDQAELHKLFADFSENCAFHFVGRGQAKILALRGGAQHHELRIAKFAVHDPTFLSSWRPERSGPVTRTSPYAAPATSSSEGDDHAPESLLWHTRVESRVSPIRVQVRACHLSSSVRPRRPSNPVDHAEARPYRDSSLRSFPFRWRSLHLGHNGCMK